MTIITAVGVEACDLPNGSEMAAQFDPATARLEQPAAAAAKVTAANAGRSQRAVSQLRDISSSPLMISNDRILWNVRATSMMSAVPTDLREHP